MKQKMKGKHVGKIVATGLLLLLSAKVYSQLDSQAGGAYNTEIQSAVKTIEAKLSPQEETGRSPEKIPAPLVAHGGLILANIQLENRNSLRPYVKENDVDYAKQAEKHTGLLIFHRNDKNGGIPSGMYIWDGRQWLRVSLLPGQ